MDMQGKKIVITGGTGALGSVIASRFLAAGADVFSSFIKDEEIERLPATLKDHPRFHIRAVSLTDEQAIADWFESLGRIDGLINVAGGFCMGSVQETTPETWRGMIAMNLETAFLTCRQALGHFSADGGRIVNVAAYAATTKPAGMTAYSVSKSGVIHLTESLAEEMLGSGVTVNAILPTIMDAPANRAAMPDADFSAWVPLDNVADTVWFLCRKESWHITGATIPLRGHC